MTPPPPIAKCIQSSESEAQNKGEKGEKRLEARTVALSVLRQPQDRESVS